MYLYYSIWVIIIYKNQCKLNNVSLYLFVFVPTCLSHTHFALIFLRACLFCPFPTSTPLPTTTRSTRKLISGNLG